MAMASNKVKFALRLPQTLYAKLTAASKASPAELSINQQIVRRLNSTFDLEEAIAEGLAADVDVGFVVEQIRASVGKSRKPTKGKTPTKK